MSKEFLVSDPAQTPGGDGKKNTDQEFKGLLSNMLGLQFFKV